MPRFTIDHALGAGDGIRIGNLDWSVVWTPGHAEGGVSFWCAEHRLVVTGDALWENGFGLLNPWAHGIGVLDRTALALDHLAELDARVVIPGHGPPFAGVPDALERARSRLAHLRARPDRLRAQAARNLLGFWLLVHPEASSDRVRDRATLVARAFPPLPNDPDPRPAGALAEEILGWAEAR